jgi:hypothetical protein
VYRLYSIKRYDDSEQQLKWLWKEEVVAHLQYDPSMSRGIEKSHDILSGIRTQEHQNMRQKYVRVGGGP